MAIKNYLTIPQRITLGNMITSHGLNVAPRTLDAYSIASNTLNTPQPVDNGPAPLIDRPLSINDIKNGLESATLSKIDKSGVFSDFFKAVTTANHQAALEVVAFWAETGEYTEAEITALNTLCSTQMPDPSWPATVPGPSWWESEFYALYPTFSANIDGINVTDKCHPLLIKEAIGDYS